MNERGSMNTRRVFLSTLVGASLLAVGLSACGAQGSVLASSAAAPFDFDVLLVRNFHPTTELRFVLIAESVATAQGLGVVSREEWMRLRTLDAYNDYLDPSVIRGALVATPYASGLSLAFMDAVSRWNSSLRLPARSPVAA